MQEVRTDNKTMTTLDHDDVFGEDGWQKIPQMPDLAGKTVFISGGGSGIGAFFTAAFALQGANVGFVSLSDDESTILCDAVEQQTGSRPFSIEADIRDGVASINTVEGIHNHFKGVA